MDVIRHFGLVAGLAIVVVVVNAQSPFTEITGGTSQSKGNTSYRNITHSDGDGNRSNANTQSSATSASSFPWVTTNGSVSTPDGSTTTAPLHSVTSGGLAPTNIVRTNSAIPRQNTYTSMTSNTTELATSPDAIAQPETTNAELTDSPFEPGLTMTTPATTNNYVDVTTPSADETQQDIGRTSDTATSAIVETAFYTENAWQTSSDQQRPSQPASSSDSSWRSTTNLTLPTSGVPKTETPSLPTNARTLAPITSAPPTATPDTLTTSAQSVSSGTSNEDANTPKPALTANLVTTRANSSGRATTAPPTATSDTLTTSPQTVPSVTSNEDANTPKSAMTATLVTTRTSSSGPVTTAPPTATSDTLTTSAQTVPSVTSNAGDSNTDSDTTTTSMTTTATSSAPTPTPPPAATSVTLGSLSQTASSVTSNERDSTTESATTATMMQVPSSAVNKSAPSGSPGISTVTTPNRNCTPINSTTNSTINGTTNITDTSCDAVLRDGKPAASSDASNAWVIVVAIIAPLGVCVMIAVVIYIVLNSRLRTSSSDGTNIELGGLSSVPEANENADGRPGEPDCTPGSGESEDIARKQEPDVENSSSAPTVGTAAAETASCTEANTEDTPDESASKNCEASKNLPSGTQGDGSDTAAKGETADMGEGITGNSDDKAVNANKSKETEPLGDPPSNTSSSSTRPSTLQPPQATNLGAETTGTSKSLEENPVCNSSTPVPNEPPPEGCGPEETKPDRQREETSSEKGGET